MPINKKKRLVDKHISLVMPIAKKYDGLGMPLKELNKHGMKGLQLAAKKSKGDLSFKRFAKKHIKEAVSRALIDSDKIIRVQVYKHGK